MRGYSKLSWFLGGVLQLMSVLLQAQVSSREARSATSLIAAKVLSPPSAGILPIERLPLPVALPSVMEPQSVPEVPNELLNTQRILEILNFWFGFLPGPDFFPSEKMPIWFASTPEIDRQIRDNFSQDIINAERGDYNAWRDTPRGRLALILLLDQFSRHIYRNQPQEFMLDRMAQALVVEGIQKGDDQRLYPVERAFFYLPLEHAEDLNLQNLSVASYRQLFAVSPDSLKPQMQDFLQAAVMHQQQIARFGRFPHRNAILGRESTPEEIVYLMQWRKG